MKALALSVAFVIVAAIVVANLGYADQVFGFLDYVPGHDVTGHFALFGLLSFAVNAWLSASGRSRTHVTAELAGLVVLEELSQALIPARTFSLVDLSASLTGLVVGAVASFVLPRAGTPKFHPEAR